MERHSPDVRRVAAGAGSGHPGSACDPTMPPGCPHVPPQIITGSGPNGPALEPATHTLYVPNFYDGTTSIVATHDPTITSREDALATSPYPLPQAESIDEL